MVRSVCTEIKNPKGGIGFQPLISKEVAAAQRKDAAALIKQSSSGWGYSNKAAQEGLHRT